MSVSRCRLTEVELPPPVRRIDNFMARRRAKSNTPALATPVTVDLPDPAFRMTLHPSRLSRRVNWASSTSRIRPRMSTRFWRRNLRGQLTDPPTDRVGTWSLFMLTERSGTCPVSARKKAM
jgi:hypothetical protein